MRAFVCPQCLRVCSEDAVIVIDGDEAWCGHNGRFHRSNQTIFLVDEETGKPIHEYTEMMEFDAMAMYHYMLEYAPH